jgi:hypothetical protein
MFATVFDVLYKYINKKKQQRLNESLITNIETEIESQTSLLNNDYERLLVNVTLPNPVVLKQNICVTIIQAFSAHRNFKKLFQISTNEKSELLCLNGIRFLSLSWVILGHTYYFIAPLTG